MKKITTSRPDEYYGNIAIDFTNDYWEKLTKNYLDTTKYTPLGFNINIDDRAHFIFEIIAQPIGATQNDEGKYPVKFIETTITWKEFSNSFVVLKARVLQNGNSDSNFEEIE
jgi:hypothetical protein